MEQTDTGSGLNGRDPNRGLRHGLLILIAVGLVTRLAAVPFASIDGGDPVSKIWIAQRWLTDPGLITSGVWGPLHTYLLALPLALFTDPVTPPIILHVLFGVATVVPLVLFVRTAIAGASAALFVGAIYLFYPVAFSNSLLVSSETPFVFFVVLCLLALARARGPEGRMGHAVAAGLALTLAGMLRYEGWMLIPLLAPLLWRNPKRAVAFVVVASLHPIFWMIGNAVVHGDPLYSLHFASYVEIEVGRATENLGLTGWLQRIAFQPLMTFLGMTPVLGGLAAAGGIVALTRRDPRAVWLFPAVAVLCLLIASTIQGSLTLKVKYTVTVGTMLVPFAAIAWERFRLGDLRVRGVHLPATLLTIGLMLAFAHATWSPIAPGYGIKPVNLIPGFPHDREARAIGELVRSELESTDGNPGFMTDAHPRVASYYVAWLSWWPAQSVYLASSVREPPFSLTDLRDFLARRPEGFVLLHRGSRFAVAAGLSESDTAELGESRFVIDGGRRVRLGDVELLLARYRALSP